VIPIIRYDENTAESPGWEGAREKREPEAAVIPGGGQETKPVSFVFFPGDSAVFSLLPAEFQNAGVFGDIQEALDFYSAKVKPAKGGGEPPGHGGAGKDDRFAIQENGDMPGHEGAGLLLVVNGLDYYRNISRLQREPDAFLLQALIKLRAASGAAGVKLLMPEDKSTGQSLLIDLMSQGFYDFWFLSALDSRLFQEILHTERSFRQLEAYLGTLPPPAVPEWETQETWRIKLKNTSLLVKTWLDKKKALAQRVKPGWRRVSALVTFPATPEAPVAAEPDFRTPAYEGQASVAPVSVASAFGGPIPEPPAAVPPASVVPPVIVPLERPVRKKGWLPFKSKGTAAQANSRAGSTALFFSEEDCLLTYALACLTAACLAEAGGKTLLVELPGSGSRLERALDLDQPEKSLRGALRDFALGARGQWRNYCFHSSGLYGGRLHLLPEGHIEEALYPSWDGFLASLVHWAIVEEQYAYVIYLGFGNQTSLCWKNSLICRQRIIAFSPWTPSFDDASYAERRWQSRCLPVFDGSWGAEQIKKRMNAWASGEYAIIPQAVKKDFIGMAAPGRKNIRISEESRQCLMGLWECFTPEKNGWEGRLL
jgi:hypothetical protein